MASIPAPTTNTAPARRAAEADAPLQDRTEKETAPSVPTDQTPDLPITPPASPLATEPAPAQPTNRSARRQKRLSVDQVAPKPENVPETLAAPVKEAESHAVVPRPDRASLLPERNVRDRSISLRPLPHEDHTPDPYRQIELLNQKRPANSTARMVLFLPLAALLGCLAGWFLFLQMPSPIIRLSVKTRGENVIVTWPPEQTRSAIYAAVRVDDSTPVPLTPEEKTTGRVEVQARPDMKVELIARNWIRDSRGIVHYVKPVANTAP